MAITEDHVREELKKVIDPELFVNIVDLGLIYTVDIKPHDPSRQSAAEPVAAEDSSAAAESTAPVQASSEEPATPEPVAADTPATDTPPADDSQASGDQLDVFIEMTMTSPMCPAGPQLIAQSKAVVGAIEEVSDVEVKVVLDPPWTPDKMTDDARDQLGIF